MSRLLRVCIGAAVLVGLVGCGRPGARIAIVTPDRPSGLQLLAAREVQRYFYVRAGLLAPVTHEADAPREADLVCIGFIPSQAPDMSAIRKQVAALPAEGYMLKTLDQAGRHLLVVAGGGDVGTLYGAYRLAEHLGVRFYLHGDVIPDRPIPPRLPAVDEVRTPLFALRGIQPFHDFPEGPDWWSTEGYKAIIGQLPKLGMNFIGFHTYPETHGSGCEPMVWIGVPEDVGDEGRVRFSYPSHHFCTLAGTWGYRPTPTGTYHCGASQLFEQDAYAQDVQEGLCPWPETPEQCNTLFNRFGRKLADAFSLARTLGVKTCIGTEVPLTVPTPVKQRLGVEKVQDTTRFYEGIFQRIMRTHPLDYYWFWTPEHWTWRPIGTEVVEATLNDMRNAIAAADKVGVPFTLATCGWVLGPQHDRALFDRELPKDMPVSCINRAVGHDPVEPGFADVTGRPKWAIPWLEDDPALTIPQLWVGRMRKDAADALDDGCTGLMGIHWRTRILGPNVSALAAAAWDQSPWRLPKDRVVGPQGGRAVRIPATSIAGTDDDVLYQTMREGLSGYGLCIENSTYTVKLYFCEPEYDAPGRRVFSIKVQGKTVRKNLDIFAEVGRHTAYVVDIPGVVVDDGWLQIDFVPRVGEPILAALSVEWSSVRRFINCGGPAYKHFLAEREPAPGTARYMPSGDFWRDWAAHLFGEGAADEIGALFARIDGKLPRPATWVKGPGGIQPDARPWESVAAEYAFVDELAALRPSVSGADNLERFDYWLNQFRYLRATAKVNCLWARFNKAMKRVDAEKDAKRKAALARERALPARKQLVAAVKKVYHYLLATVSNTGEMGTIANWEQHIVPVLLDQPGEALEAALGQSLPADARLPFDYTGPARMFVPEVRTVLRADEVLRLKVIILDRRQPAEPALYWRPLGRGAYTRVPLTHVARGVWIVALPEPAGRIGSFEYYLQAAASDGRRLTFPVGAPRQTQTVVVMPEEVPTMH